VVHATSQWSAQHLEDAAEDVAGALLSQFGDMVDDALPKPVFMQAHRWRFALPSDNPASTQFALWNPQIQLGACGDWLGGNGVEAAWLSGRALATRMLEGWRKGA
jgi:predicted NAD/FAD-dependent oxidoreductase